MGGAIADIWDKGQVAAPISFNAQKKKVRLKNINQITKAVTTVGIFYLKTMCCAGDNLFKPGPEYFAVISNHGCQFFFHTISFIGIKMCAKAHASAVDSLIKPRQPDAVVMKSKYVKKRYMYKYL